MTDHHMTVEQALEIADAREWSGDPRVNWATAMNAACVLAHEVRRTRDVLAAARELLPQATSLKRRRLEDVE